MRPHLVEPPCDLLFVEPTGVWWELHVLVAPFELDGRVIESVKVDDRVFPLFQFHEALAHSKDRIHIVFFAGVQVGHLPKHRQCVLAPAKLHERQPELMIGQGIVGVKGQQPLVDRFGLLISACREELPCFCADGRPFFALGSCHLFGQNRVEASASIDRGAMDL